MKSNSFEKPEEPAKETAQEIMPVSVEFLKSFYSSPDFLKTLKRAVRIMNKREGWESGFVMLKDLETDQVLISDIAESEEQTETDLGLVIRNLEIQARKKFPERKFAGFGSFHFHPRFFEDRPIIPSGIERDLSATAESRLRNRSNFDYDIIPIEMIAEQTRDKKEVVILVYQEPINFSLEETPTAFEDLDLSLKEVNTQDEVLELLRGEGYRAEILRTKGLGFTPDDLQKLASFAYTPRSVKISD